MSYGERPPEWLRRGRWVTRETFAGSGTYESVWQEYGSCGVGGCLILLLVFGVFIYFGWLTLHAIANSKAIGDQIETVGARPRDSAAVVTGGGVPSTIQSRATSDASSSERDRAAAAAYNVGARRIEAQADRYTGQRRQLYTKVEYAIMIREVSLRFGMTEHELENAWRQYGRRELLGE